MLMLLSEELFNIDYDVIDIYSDPNIVSAFRKPNLDYWKGIIITKIKFKSVKDHLKWVQH